MRVLRLFVAGMIGFAAIAGVLFAALIVLVTGIVAYVIQLFRRPAGPGPALQSATRMQMDDVIDVVSTKVPPDPPGR